ncbi:FAD-dependent monooxygenase [Kribbella sp. NPDC050124]|uniref:FAD-dependent monooxygenase n=1 Tax=Kribbella sp. NPDC050124 TaxID=3364114 RepID=UPI0037B0BAD1
MTDLLVVGAGPTGLTTALQAAAHGATVRVVERRPDAFRPSRALIVHPRTLECLRPLGVTGELLDRGDISPRAELHLGHRRVSIELSGLDLPDTAFPHLTLVRQSDVEAVLAQALTRRGVEIERGAELTDVAFAGHGDDLVRATLRSATGTEETTCRFVAGCDGPDSTVRGLAGIGWRGASYREEVVLADVELTGDLSPGVVHVAAGRNGLLFVFSLGEGATWRVLATRPIHGAPDAAFGQPGGDVPAPELQHLIDDSGLTAAIEELRWSARVRLQHRLAAAYRYRRLFLAGDAAHTHSPAGGQGMNIGIQDAVNLGWKLAYAAGRERCSELLDSYDRERRPVARKVLAMTHLIFFAEASTHPLPAFLRGTLAPLAAPAVPVLMRRQLLAEGIRTLSQLRVNYHGSPLSQVGTAPADRQLQPGDRLPDATVTCDGRTVRLHELTASPGIHLLLSRDADQPDPVGPRVHVHRLTSRPGHDVVAVRPDGYVGLHTGPADPAVLRSWLDLVGAPCESRDLGASSY